jgi:membrane-bound metal-dependent hydrolase YbcI (DUF457 family)
MDIFSHGLYGGVAFGRKSKKEYWTAFFFGIAPDVMTFALPFFLFVGSAIFSGEIMDPPRPGSGYANIPDYVFSLYDITHSLVIFFAVFAVLWVLRKRPYWLMCGWGLHIIVDIFTHSTEFFPTPFLWPISDFAVNGRSWGSPEIFIPNILLLFGIYGYWWYLNRKKRAS